MKKKPKQDLLTISARIGWDVDELVEHLRPYEPIRARGQGGTGVVFDAREGSEEFVVKIPFRPTLPRK